MSSPGGPPPPRHARQGLRARASTLQRRYGNQAVLRALRAQDSGAAGVHEVLRSPGRPLDVGARSLFEPRFKRDFGGVRVHTGARAAESAKAVQALAYTVGQNIVFGQGQYSPETVAGRRLLAHELAHTIQQDSGAAAPQAQLEIGGPDDAAEREAESIASAVLAGRDPGPVSRRPARLSRWSITGSTATVDNESDRLGLIPDKVKSRADNWVCISPISMKTAGYTDQPADFQTHYEKYLQIGDQFDISNLTATGGGSSRMNFHREPDIQTLLSTERFYPGIKKLKDVVIDEEIGRAAGEGRTPLGELIMAGHGSGSEMRGSGCAIMPSSLKADEPAPTYDRAKAKQLPRRCWFTTDAAVRSIGCHSMNFGIAFGNVYLRKGTKIDVTLRQVRPSCTAPYRSPPNDENRTCELIDSMEFVPDKDEEHKEALHGPFQNATDFHASPLWTSFDPTL